MARLDAVKISSLFLLILVPGLRVRLAVERDIYQRGLVEHTGTKRNDIGFRAIEARPASDDNESGLKKHPMVSPIDAPDVDVCSDCRRWRTKYQPADVNPVVILVSVSRPHSSGIGIN
jgi:hypothetical protein